MKQARSGRGRSKGGDSGRFPPAPAPRSPAPAAHRRGVSMETPARSSGTRRGIPSIPSIPSSGRASVSGHRGSGRAKREGSRRETARGKRASPQERRKKPSAPQGQGREGLLPPPNPPLCRSWQPRQNRAPSGTAAINAALAGDGTRRTTPRHRSGRPCPGVRTRAISGDTEPPVPPGAGQPLPMGTGRARTQQRCRQLSA